MALYVNQQQKRLLGMAIIHTIVGFPTIQKANTDMTAATTPILESQGFWHTLSGILDTCASDDLLDPGCRTFGRAIT